MLAVHEPELTQVLDTLHPLFLQFLQSVHRNRCAAVGDRRSVQHINHIDMPVACLGVLLCKTVENISHAQTVTADFVCIGRTDTFTRRTDFGFAFGGLVGLVQQSVGRQNKVRFLRYIQPLLQLVTGGSQLLRLFAEQDRVQHYAVTDQVDLATLEDTGRNTAQHVFLTLELQRVTGIRTALKTGYYIVLRREHIHHFAFALIAPLES